MNKQRPENADPADTAARPVNDGEIAETEFAPPSTANTGNGDHDGVTLGDRDADGETLGDDARDRDTDGDFDTEFVSDSVKYGEGDSDNDCARTVRGASSNSAASSPMPPRAPRARAISAAADARWGESRSGENKGSARTCTLAGPQAASRVRA